MEIVFSIREQDGTIVNRQAYRGNDRLRFHGPYDKEFVDIMEKYPKYTRGKLKGEIAWREVPSSEYGEMELVLSVSKFEEVINGESFSTNGHEFDSYSNYRIEDTKLYIERKDQYASQQSIFETVERELCQDIKYIHSMKDLEKNVMPIYNFINDMHSSKEVFLKRECWGYDNERVSLYVGVEGHGYRRIKELSYDQKKMFSFFTGESTKMIGCLSCAEAIEKAEEDKKRIMGDYWKEC